MAGFGDIPVRQNGVDQLIEASWFNTIRTKLVNAFGQGSYMFVQDTQTLSSGGTITLEAEAFKPFVPVVGNAGPVTLSNLPFGSSHGFGSGKEIVLMGTDDTNTVTLVSNDSVDGLILNGVSVELRSYHKILLMWWEEGQRFVELERNF